MRRGREVYSKNYEAALELHKKGTSIRVIAKQLGISYSCAYHWVRGLRKPKTGNINGFEDLIKRGPVSAAEISSSFPKHNELFLTASRRGVQIKRLVLPRRYGEYSTWYFVSGQEERLRERIKELLDKYKEAKEKVINLLNEVTDI